MKKIFENWVIDLRVTVPEGMLCFIPFVDDEFITGMNVITDKCPGNLTGVIHETQELCDKWCADNPDWHTEYSNN